MDSSAAKSECNASGGADRFDRDSGCEPGLSNWGEFISSEAGGFRAVRERDSRPGRLLAVDGQGSRDNSPGAGSRSQGLAAERPGSQRTDDAVRLARTLAPAVAGVT